MNLPEDQSRALTELLKAAAKYLATATPHPVEEPESALDKAKQWVNTPFFVTVIGGMVATVLTFGLQAISQQAAQAEAARAEQLRRQQAAVELRMSVLLSFTDKFPGSIGAEYEYIHTALWVGDTKNFNKSHPSGRSYAEMWKRKEQLGDAKNLIRSPESFPPQISGSFTNQDVRSIVTELKSQMTELFEAGSEKALNESLEKCSKNYLILVERMNLEIQQTRDAK